MPSRIDQGFARHPCIQTPLVFDALLRAMGKAKLAVFLVRNRKLVRIAILVLVALGAWFVWQQFA